MFSGLRSRWTTPISCATASAASTCERTSTTRPFDSGHSSSDHPQEVLAVEELHRDVEQALFVLAEVEDPHGVRVIEPRRGLGLSLEARGEGRVLGVLRVHHLEGHDLVEGELAGLVDLTHRPAADVGLDVELSGDGLADERAIDAVHRTKGIGRDGPSPCASMRGRRASNASFHARKEPLSWAVATGPPTGGRVLLDVRASYVDVSGAYVQALSAELRSLDNAPRRVRRPTPVRGPPRWARGGGRRSRC